VILAPNWFLDGFPSIPIDGELWCGPHSFEKCSRIVLASLEENHSNTSNDKNLFASQLDWIYVRFLAFDTPTSQLKYEERIELLSKYLHSKPRWILLVHSSICRGSEDLAESLYTAEMNGSEGIALRKSNAYYCDPSSFLRWKRFLDEEAQVLDKDSAMITCQLISGDQVSFPSTRWNLSISSVVTFRYGGQTDDGKPMHSYIVKPRPDLNWDQCKAKKNEIPFQVGFAKRNVAVKCRGCKRLIADKRELRIQLKTSYQSLHSGPHPAIKSFCLNANCVERAIERDRAFHNTIYPTFDGRVSISSELKKSLGMELPKLDKIHWVVI